MWKNYFKIASRNLLRNRMYSLINVIGLSLGLASAMLIFLFVWQFLSFDNFISKKEQLYRIVYDNKRALGVDKYSGHTPFAFAPALRLEHPDLQFTRIRYDREMRVNSENKKLVEKNTLFADEYFFQLLNYPFLIGNPKTVLSTPNTVVLTETIAKKYFGSIDNAMGKKLKIDSRFELQVRGIIKDVPANSHIHFTMVFSFDVFDDYQGMKADKHWNGTSNGITYAYIPENLPKEKLESQFKEFQKKHQNKGWAENNDFKLLALSDVPFAPEYATDAGKVISYNFLWGLLMVALVILLVASINYINLSTAQSLKRSKEIGLKKVMGSSRLDLAIQFLGETFILTLSSSVIATILLELSLPFINIILSNPIEINIWTNLYFWMALLTMTFFVSILSGLYPSVVLSGLNPVKALKGNITTRNSGSLYLRRTLVILQFGIAQTLVIVTIVMMSQMQYFLNKDLGFNQEAILLVEIPLGDARMYYEEEGQRELKFLSRKIAENPAIQSHTFMMEAAISESYFTTIFSMPESKNPEEEYSVHLQTVDSNYINVFEIELLAGQNFSKPYTTDTILRREILVNEAFVKSIGVRELNEAIGLLSDIDGTPCVIRGVVKDFHVHSFRESIEPFAMLNRPFHWYQVALKIKAEEASAIIADLQAVWQERYPDFVFQYEFLDQNIALMYEQEIQMQRIFQIFAFIAIIISCLGLYGLVSFVAAQRTKEIGVRKVLGATVMQILFLFSKEFTRLVLIAFVIAAPIGYFLMQEWLKDFVYKINLGAGVFIISISISLVIAWLTVGYISLKAARLNPVEVLKDE